MKHFESDQAEHRNTIFRTAFDRRTFLGAGLGFIAAAAGKTIFPAPALAQTNQQYKSNANSRLDPHSLFTEIRERLLNNQEIAFLDVREEVPHAQGHPLFAASMPLSRIELDAYTVLPRKEVPVVVIDGGEGYAARAMDKLKEIGYKNVRVFAGGTSAWASAGGQLFRDINVPSKSFGELVHSRKHTPELTPADVEKLAQKGNVVVLDVRRPDEYETFSIPGAKSVPGGDVVLQFPGLVPNDSVQVVVNCAGRTRGLLWSQSLINAGVKNPVAALRNGTIGWTLAGLPLAREQKSTACGKACKSHFKPAVSARNLANRAHVKRATWQDVQKWQSQSDKTSYFFDVRSHQEYLKAHLPGWRNAPSGEVVQELMMYAPVRGARIVLVDDDGVRANMAASWLAQMNCDVWVLDQPPAFTASGEWPSQKPQEPAVTYITAAELQDLLQASSGANGNLNDVAVIDFSRHSLYATAHIPGAWFALRSDLRDAIAKIPKAKRYVITDRNGQFAAYVAPELAQLVTQPVDVLKGGNSAWDRAGYAFEKGTGKLASPAIDRFERPYENPDSDNDVTFDPAKIKAYISWLAGSNLMKQLSEDGTSGFWVL